ncbi:aromatic amino acid aminotransferase [Bacterioplanes sanyensis]|uniref:Aromatic amino acid aminotransferase n=1 Tax=Bacterioplanes sanyensis TaxID=1249553 RepID=A0A222FLU4_9GAMM|nr:amino acid aminotransferase [Bacterioplanes sanyensis]ASP39642.1 aromatic amino acid aminotransferase [Bacterioplanes sanyensis]
MFQQLDAPAKDPILSLTVAYREDAREDKLDLGIGVYRDSQGHTPVMQAVRSAALTLADQQDSKGYVGLAGNERFNDLMSQFLLAGTSALARSATIQTPGASGALRMLGELIAYAKPNATVWISRPSYVNHQPVMEACGLEVREYPYFDPDTKLVNEAAMLESLRQLGPDDVLLLHGCCHNPTGADISMATWQAIADLAEQQGFVPFVDLAYQGFGDNLDADAAGLRLLAERLPEVLVAVSCSKNFGLYRERTGAAIVIGATQADALRGKGHMQRIARATYTMPPDHGAAIVAMILENDALKQQWLDELQAMQARIQRLRQQLVAEFRSASDSHRFDYFAEHRGMFSVTGLSAEQTQQLSAEQGVYVVGGGRVNVAGLSEDRIGKLVSAFLAVGA